MSGHVTPPTCCSCELAFKPNQRVAITLDGRWRCIPCGAKRPKETLAQGTYRVPTP